MGIYVNLKEVLTIEQYSKLHKYENLGFYWTEMR